jgi:hypothetical protein
VSDKVIHSGADWRQVASVQMHEWPRKHGAMSPRRPVVECSIQPLHAEALVFDVHQQTIENTLTLCALSLRDLTQSQPVPRAPGQDTRDAAPGYTAFLSFHKRTWHVDSTEVSDACRHAVASTARHSPHMASRQQRKYHTVQHVLTVPTRS